MTRGVGIGGESHPGMESRMEVAVRPCLRGSVLTSRGPTVPGPGEVMAGAEGTRQVGIPAEGEEGRR